MPSTLHADIPSVWKRLEAWCSSHLPVLLHYLNPGASSRELASLEDVIGHTLPNDVRDSYLIHNGQNTGEPTGLIFGLPLLSVSSVEQQWKFWRGVDSYNETLKETAASVPKGAVQLEYTCRSWIPLSQDHGGNNLGVDLAPGPKGTVGQVIIFGRDEDTKYVAAPSWSSFLAGLVSTLEAGNFRINEKQFLSVRKPACNHYHDYIRKMVKPR